MGAAESGPRQALLLGRPFLLLGGVLRTALAEGSAIDLAAACLAVTLTHAALLHGSTCYGAGESRREFRRAQRRTLPGCASSDRHKRCLVRNRSLGYRPRRSGIDKRTLNSCGESKRP